MNWFVSSDKKIVVNLDHFYKIIEVDGVFKLCNPSAYVHSIELTKEQYNELIEFIEQRSVVYISSDTVTSKKGEYAITRKNQ
jgi:hypothetical protein